MHLFSLHCPLIQSSLKSQGKEGNLLILFVFSIHLEFLIGSSNSMSHILFEGHSFKNEVVGKTLIQIPSSRESEH